MGKSAAWIWNTFPYRDRGTDGGKVPRLAHKSPFNPQCVGILELTVLHELCAHNGTVELVYLDGKPFRVGNTAVSSHPCGHSKEPGGEQNWPLHV